MPSLIDQFELAQLYYTGCLIDKAEQAFVEAAHACEASGDFARYVECQTKLLRIYTERQDNEKIFATIETLNSFASDERKQSSSVLYALGLCATYQRRYVDAALNFKAALERALATNDQSDMAYALYGMIAVYWVEGRHVKALQELQSLRVVTEAVGLAELEMTSYITEALILMDLSRSDEALALLEATSSQILARRNWYLHLFLMYATAKAYARVGKFDRARLYGELAGASADPKNFKNLSAQIEVLLQNLKTSTEPACEVYFDPMANLVVIENQKRVDLKNQFILLELLRVFTAEPGRAFSKQELIERVWKEQYDPLVHDNKIYVTIKRLRKLIETDFEKPKYILRSGRGYVFNPATNLVRAPEAEHLSAERLPLTLTKTRTKHQTTFNEKAEC